MNKNEGHDKWTYTITTFLHLMGNGTTLTLSKFKEMCILIFEMTITK